MKKILYIAGIGIAATLGVSCSSNNAETSDESLISQAQIDSVSMLYGQTAAAQALQMVANDTALNKEAVVKAMQAAFANDADESTLAGLYFAHTLMSNIYTAKQHGLDYDKAKVLKEFKRVFLQDSISQDQLMEIGSKYEAINNSIQAKLDAKAQAEKAEAPEAIQNVKTGEAFVAKAKAADPEIKTTDSGLSYKIENPGDATRPTDTDMISIIYKGAFTDGSVFDESKGEPLDISLAGIIPGLREGLKLIGKGGKAKFYIPGNLGYGVDGVPQVNIGPNQMLVFDIEVVDIKPMAQN